MKIVYLMGKSASGKDSIYNVIKSDRELGLKNIVIYTTRPMRENENNGKEYFFIDEKKAEELEASGKVIEERVYSTVYGPWKYMTVNDGQFCDDSNYLIIGTLESYNKIKKYFGSKVMIPVYIEVEDGERLIRAIEREKRQSVPKYEEMCRRFIADQSDFSEEKLEEAGITRRFKNTDIESCIYEINKYIRESIV